MGYHTSVMDDSKDRANMPWKPGALRCKIEGREEWHVTYPHDEDWATMFIHTQHHGEVFTHDGWKPVKDFQLFSKTLINKNIHPLSRDKFIQHGIPRCEEVLFVG